MEIKKKEVEKLIELKKKDTFFNHLWNIITRDFRAKGEINQNKIMVWRQNFWNMTFYPIFIFEFNSKNHLVNITDKMNPVGKAFNVLIFLGFLLIIFPKQVGDFQVLAHWKIISLIITVIFLAVFLGKKVYQFERQNQLDQIFEILDIEIEKKQEENERSLSKLITRLLLYPFCIGLIILAIAYMLPTGEYILALGSLLIAGTYLYSDIKIQLKRKTTGNSD